MYVVVYPFRGFPFPASFYVPRLQLNLANQALQALDDAIEAESIQTSSRIATYMTYIGAGRMPNATCDDSLKHNYLRRPIGGYQLTQQVTTLEVGVRRLIDQAFRLSQIDIPIAPAVASTSLSKRWESASQLIAAVMTNGDVGLEESVLTQVFNLLADMPDKAEERAASTQMAILWFGAGCVALIVVVLAYVGLWAGPTAACESQTLQRWGEQLIPEEQRAWRTALTTISSCGLTRAFSFAKVTNSSASSLTHAAARSGYSLTTKPSAASGASRQHAQSFGFATSPRQSRFQPTRDTKVRARIRMSIVDRAKATVASTLMYREQQEWWSASRGAGCQLTLYFLPVMLAVLIMVAYSGLASNQEYAGLANSIRATVRCTVVMLCTLSLCSLWMEVCLGLFSYVGSLRRFIHLVIR